MIQLCDGLQGEGVFFSVEDKLRVAKKLDSLGIDYIEGATRLPTPKIFEFYYEASKLNLKTAKLVAFGSTRRAE